MKKGDEKKRIEIQPRDRAILRDLLDGRVMTIKQAASLHFGGSFEAAKKRLQKLHGAGLVVMRARKVQDPAIYSLSRDGYLSLKEDGMLDPLFEVGWGVMRKRLQVSEMTLRHELAVMDVKAALAPAIRTVGLRLKEFSVCPTRHAFYTARALIRAGGLAGFRSGLVMPDGFIEVVDASGREHSYFLEVDRGSETLERVARKVLKYAQHYRNGGFAAKRGFGRKDFKSHPFRLLVVVPSAERRNNVAEKLIKSKTTARSLAWLATMKELLANPLGVNWLRPVDYDAALHGTALDGAPSARKAIYRRQSEREALIEINAVKHELFGG